MERRTAFQSPDNSLGRAIGGNAGDTAGIAVAFDGARRGRGHLCVGDREGHDAVTRAAEIDRVVEVGRVPEEAADRARDRLHNLAVGSRLPAAEMIAVENINAAFLARAYHQVRMSGAARFITQQGDARRAGVHVGVVEGLLIEWREVIEDGQPAAASELDVTLAKVGAAGGAIPGAVGGDDVDVGVGVHRRRSAAGPERTEAAFRRAVEHRYLRERLRIVANQPAVIRADIAMRRPGRVNHAIEQEQAGALLVISWDEAVDAAAVAGSG